MLSQALVLVDLQNAFCSRRGSFWKRGNCILNLDQVLEKVESLLDFAHENHIPVVFTKLEFEPDYSDAGLLIKKNDPQIAEIGAYRKGSWDSELYRFRNRREGDLIVTKKRYDPFVGTRLTEILDRLQVNALIVAGVVTNVCVESCVRSAFDRDFQVTLVEDACSSYSEELHRASLATLKNHFAEVVLSENLEGREGIQQQVSSLRN